MESTSRIVSALKKPSPLSLYFFVALLFIQIVVWAYLLWTNFINGDTAWLILAAERVLDGHSSARFIYEPNVPFTYVFHIPIVLLNRLAGIPLYYASFLYFLLFLAFGLWAMQSVLSRLDFVNRIDRLTVITFYLLSCTILASHDFGQRDQIIGIILCPFILGQLALTYKWQVPRSTLLAIFWVGAILVMLKPHFGLVPAGFLLHRIIIQRRLWIIRDPDLVALTLATFLHIAVLFLFFPSFIHQTFIDDFRYYFPNKSTAVLPSTAFPVVALITFALCSFALPILSAKRFLSLCFFFAAFLALGAYAAQMKGFHYQFLPFEMLAACGLGLMISSFLQTVMSQDNTLLAGGLVGSIIVLGIAPLNFHFLNHDLYLKPTMPLAMAVEQDSPNKTCPFFFLNENMAYIPQISLYSGREHGSRMPTMWTFPALLKNERAHVPGTNAEKMRFANYYAEDLQYWRPCVALIGRFDIDKTPFSFISFSSISPAFNEAWSHYKYARTITVNRKDYFPKSYLDFDHIMIYDEYVRLPE